MIFDIIDCYSGVCIDVQHLVQEVSCHNINAVTVYFDLTVDDLFLKLEGVLLLNER